MSVDKFGRSSKSQDKKLLQGPRGEGFNLTPSGDYDIKNKRLCNLATPKNTHDAVTKGYVDFKSIPFTNEKYTLNDNKRLSNVGDPVDVTDAVNLKTLNKRASHWLTSSKNVKRVLTQKRKKSQTWKRGLNPAI